MSTKKPASKRSTSDLRSEYRFDYSKSRSNRFAKKMSEGTVAVVLEPDVASVFESSESVNEFLRSAIKAMPERSRKRRAG
jgi:hypothetical protein